MEDSSNTEYVSDSQGNSPKANNEEIDYIPLDAFDSLKSGLVFANETIIKNSIKRWQDKFFMPFITFKNDSGRYSLKLRKCYSWFEIF